ncbi:hypothetical protein [Mycetocola zhujimingii]|uniref:hypothetical protein n=1 Tax=Mycetocola zhujimingii TaxID=2079792 RepID=UPI000D3631F3|nr:hypothetical protein [Mycetocola zhujimingii]AWB86559.1 hypothetical protein C3E77_07980 [Mycetocola zhujimingii]
MQQRQLSSSDLDALRGVLSIVELHLMTDSLPVAFVDDLRTHFRETGAANRVPDSGIAHRDVRQALSDLAQQIYYVQGEYQEPNPSFPVWNGEVAEED